MILIGRVGQAAQSSAGVDPHISFRQPWEQRVHQPLQRRDHALVGDDQVPAGDKDASHLGEGDFGVGLVVQRVDADDGLYRAIGQRRPFGVGELDVGRRTKSVAGDGNHGRREVDVVHRDACVDRSDVCTLCGCRSARAERTSGSSQRV
mgnify:CR=1 FL=1